MILEKNKQERHIRGGLATRKKYALLAQQREQQKHAHFYHPAAEMPVRRDSYIQA